MAEQYVTVRVTAKAGRSCVACEKDPRHPGGEAKVKGVGTEHTVGETPNVVQGIRNGMLAIVSTSYEGEAADLPIPQGIWRSAGLEPVEGAETLGDLPTAILERMAGAGARSKVQREFIAAAEDEVLARYEAEDGQDEDAETDEDTETDEQD